MAPIRPPLSPISAEQFLFIQHHSLQTTPPRTNKIDANNIRPGMASRLAPPPIHPSALNTSTSHTATFFNQHYPYTIQKRATKIRPGMALNHPLTLSTSREKLKENNRLTGSFLRAPHSTGVRRRISTPPGLSAHRTRPRQACRPSRLSS